MKYGTNIHRNGSPLTFILPASYSLDDLQKTTRILFEVLNIPSLYVLEEPLAVVYGTGYEIQDNTDLLRALWWI